jgi:hypothetical protein
MLMDRRLPAQDKVRLIYDGRLWVKMILRGRTKMAMQLAAKHMRVTEELGKDMLLSIQAKEAPMYSQLEGDAMHAGPGGESRGTLWWSWLM